MGKRKEIWKTTCHPGKSDAQCNECKRAESVLARLRRTTRQSSDASRENECKRAESVLAGLRRTTRQSSDASRENECKRVKEREDELLWDQY